MKNELKYLNRWAKISIFLLFLLAAAVAVKAGDYTYTTNSDNTLTVTYYSGPGGEVDIPSVIEGRSVTIIGSDAFGGNLFIPNTTLTGVTIPDSVISIETFAFWRCARLTSVSIGNGMTSIGGWAFSGCSRLTNITIPNGVTNIGEKAFGDCVSLTSMTIPDSVTTIADLVFVDCFSLTNVMLGRGVATIGSEVFLYCHNLTSIAVNAENSVYSSLDGVLFNKCQTTLIKYPEGKTGGYIIPDGVTSIERSAFSSSGLTVVTIPDSVTILCDAAFAYCTDLTSVNIGNSISHIGDSAFEGCDSLTRFTIPDSVTNIGSDAFSSCNSLTSITIPNNVSSIGDYAFFDCTDLMGVHFMGNAPGISSNIFSGDNIATVYYLPGTTGWGPTFGGRPAIQWWDGPQISANGIRGDISINRANTLKIAVAMNADNHVGFPVDWWILARAGSDWFYLNNSGQWTQFDGNISNCHPAYQGGLFNLPAVEVLNVRGLQPGSYTFWFAVDYPMDGILNLGGYILIDSVNVTVE